MLMFGVACATEVKEAMKKVPLGKKLSYIGIVLGLVGMTLAAISLIL